MMTRRNFIVQSTLAATSVLSRGDRVDAEAGRIAPTLHERLAADPLRPQYHFLPKANWVNDPNGPIFWKGYYHLFYQYSSTIEAQGPKYWGHARSRDMVRWEHLPLALAPTPGGPDKDGCWSGSAFVNDGVPTLVYTGVFPQVQCLAASDDDMATWKKSVQNPVVGSPPAGPAVTGFRDPSIWGEGNFWLMTVGTGVQGQGGAVLLYGSMDLIHWEYLHPLCGGSPFEPRKYADSSQYDAVDAGDMWECPDFFPLGQKHVLLVSTQGRVHSLVGTYSDRKFQAESQDLADGSEMYYAAKSFLDHQGRRILWGWVREARSAVAQNSAGWSGAISLPRVLSIDSDGVLCMDPVPELASLRGRHHRIADAEVSGFFPVPNLQGTSLEIQLAMDLTDAKVGGISVCRSPNAEEETTISYDAAAQKVVLATGQSSLSRDSGGATYQGSLRLGTGELLRLTVFLDGSIVEVFANSRRCLTGRIYPTRNDSLGVGIFAREGRARVKSLDAYELDAISPDRLTT
ncbi:MAG: glycoside hydrolase family 32 protein [Terriglobia bacterium]|jgi:beta-fructofuranosidase